MNSIEIPDIHFRAEIPSHWDEMNPVQVAFCLRQAVFASLGVITPLEAKVRCLYHLLDIQRDWKTDVWERSSSDALVQEKRSKVVILSEQLCSFIFKESDPSLRGGGTTTKQSVNEAAATRASARSDAAHPTSDTGHPTLEVHYNTLTNHFPQIKAGKTLLHGPGDLLTGMTFGEFRTALVHMGDYFESKGKDQSCLSRMIACLYRPAPEDLEARKKREDWDGQTRVRFNADRIAEYANHCAAMSIVHRNAVLLWFTFCIDYVKKNPITINGIEANFSILFEGSGGGMGTGWSGVVYGVAEKKIFGDADDVDRRDWLEVFFYLYDKELENRRLKTKLKSKSR